MKDFKIHSAPEHIAVMDKGETIWKGTQAEFGELLTILRAKKSDMYAVMRTDGEDVDHEYVGFFQHGKDIAFSVADELASNYEGDDEPEFAVYALVRVNPDE